MSNRAHPTATRGRGVWGVGHTLLAAGRAFARARCRRCGWRWRRESGASAGGASTAPAAAWPPLSMGRPVDRSGCASSPLFGWRCLCFHPQFIRRHFRKKKKKKFFPGGTALQARFTVPAKAPQLSSFSRKVSHCFQQQDSHTAEYLIICV